MLADRDKIAIVRAILSLAQALGMDTTAEGIETNELAQTLAALGCTFGQGYVYARPLEADAAYDFLMAANSLSDFFVGDRRDARRVGETFRDPAILDPRAASARRRARRSGPCATSCAARQRQARRCPVRRVRSRLSPASSRRSIASSVPSR